jgi:acyl-CoA thioester hydrolase
MLNRFIYPLRIHIEDTDCTGIVYHSNYLNFMERARSEWLEELGYGIDWQREQQAYFPVYSVQMNFIKPARTHELVEVVSCVKAIRSASIIFDQYLRSAQSDDKILCKAEIKLACVDDHMRPRPLPKASILETIRRTLT